MAEAPSKSIAILGGGITGLTAAFRLTRRGHRVRLFEAQDRVGGAIRTEHVDGWLIEAGPNSLLAADPAIDALIDELGLGPERVEASSLARNRYIVRGGRLLAAPLSPPALLRSPLFSTGAKLRVLREFLVGRAPRSHDVSLEDFMRDHFGQEIVDYGVNPFVAGVYAGNPRKLSARHAFPALWQAEQRHGSLLRGQMAAAKASGGRTKRGIISFRRGLQSLPAALAAQLPEGTVELNARVQAVNSSAPDRWEVAWTDRSSARSASFDVALVALPGPALAQLQIQGVRPLASLDTIEHPPVASLFLGYRREDVGHPLDGFGMLVPEVEGRTLLGALFSSTLFPDRAPADHVALTVLVGGTRHPDLARLSADRLLEKIESDLRALLGVRGPPVFRRHTFWPRAIPQYDLGYERHLATIAEIERAQRGLFFGGQVRDGISLPACIAAGERLAGQVN